MVVLTSIDYQLFSESPSRIKLRLATLTAIRVFRKILHQKAILNDSVMDMIRLVSGLVALVSHLIK